MSIKPPCLNCEDRKLGCHGVCKDYYEYTLSHEQEKRANKFKSSPIISNSSFVRGNALNSNKYRKSRRK